MSMVLHGQLNEKGKEKKHEKRKEKQQRIP